MLCLGAAKPPRMMLNVGSRIVWTSEYTSVLEKHLDSKEAMSVVMDALATVGLSRHVTEAQVRAKMRRMSLKGIVY